MNIIGLGNVGCRVASKITEHNEAVYSTFLIDITKHKGAKSKKIHNHIMCSTMPVGVMGSDTSTLALNVNRDKDMYKKIIK